MFGFTYIICFVFLGKRQAIKSNTITKLNSLKLPIKSRGTEHISDTSSQIKEHFVKRKAKVYSRMNNFVHLSRDITKINNISNIILNKKEISSMKIPISFKEMTFGSLINNIYPTHQRLKFNNGGNY